MTSLHADRDVRTNQMDRIWSGFVAESPVRFDDRLKVVIPDLNPTLAFEDVRWDSVSSADPPAKGDSVLVIFDNNREPWALAIWPPQTPGGATAAPSGPAGGDLSGTYPNPVVARASGLFFLGTAGDTYLYRSSAGLVYAAINLATGSFQTSGWILVGSDLYMRNASPHIWFGPSDDAVLYRYAANWLATNGALWAGWSTAVGSGDISLVASGDGWPRVQLLNNSYINFGPGTAGTDTNLYRLGANSLQTDGYFTVGKRLYVNEGYLSFGTPYDTVLYRSAAYTLHVNELLEVNQSVKIGVSNNAFLGLVQDTAMIYFGVNNDVNLYRAGVDNLKTDDSLTIGNSLVVGTGDPNAHIYFGSNLDTNLYRNGVGQLKTDGSLTVLKGVSVGNSAQTGWSIDSMFGDVGARQVLRLGINTDVQPRFAAMAGGQLNWGPGGSTAVDTNLYRSAANALKTDSNFLVSATISVAWNSALAIQITGASGGVTFAGDTNLYRSGAGALRTDGVFQVNGTIYAAMSGNVNGFVHYAPSLVGYNAFSIVKQGDAQYTWQVSDTGTMAWGAGGTTAPDTNLYRSGVNTLTTNSDIFSTKVGWLIGGTTAGYKIRMGQAVVTTTGAFDAAVSYDVAFPNASVVVVAMNGNVAAAGFTPQLVSQSASGFVVRCVGLAANQGVSLTYIALGY